MTSASTVATTRYRASHRGLRSRGVAAPNRRSVIRVRALPIAAIAPSRAARVLANGSIVAYRFAPPQAMASSPALASESGAAGYGARPHGSRSAHDPRSGSLLVRWSPGAGDRHVQPRRRWSLPSALLLLVRHGGPRPAAVGCGAAALVRRGVLRRRDAQVRRSASA